MTTLEYGINKGLVKYEINELYGTLTITFKEVYPKDKDDVIEILERMVEEYQMEGE